MKCLLKILIEGKMLKKKLNIQMNKSKWKVKEVCISSLLGKQKS